MKIKHLLFQSTLKSINKNSSRIDNEIENEHIMLFTPALPLIIFNKLTHTNLRPINVNKTIGTNKVGIIYKNNNQAGWANQLKQRSNSTMISDNKAIVSSVANQINTVRLEHFKHALK